MESDKQPSDFGYLVERFESIAHCRELGFSVVDITRGEASMQVAYDPRLAADPDTGIIHGGVVTTLLDTVCGIAAMSMVRADKPVATLDLRIDYLKPATPGKAIVAAADCYKCTTNVAFVRGIAYHDDRDNPIANCTATYMVRGTGQD